jgi:hypothetical protein
LSVPKRLHRAGRRPPARRELVDARGKVLGKFYGARDWDDAEAAVWLNTRLGSTK